MAGFDRPSERVVQLHDFFIDRFEVSNRDFEQFVRDGGYRRRELWKQPFVDHGNKLSFEQAPQADDHVLDAHGLRVLVDPKSAPIVAGSTLEFNDALLGGGFKMNNPQAVHECACGESFSI